MGHKEQQALDLSVNRKTDQTSKLCVSVYQVIQLRNLL